MKRTPLTGAFQNDMTFRSAFKRSPYLAELKVNAEQFFQAGLHDLPLESVDFSGSKQKSEGLAAFQQEAGTGAK